MFLNVYELLNFHFKSIKKNIYISAVGPLKFVGVTNSQLLGIQYSWK